MKFVLVSAEDGLRIEVDLLKKEVRLELPVVGQTSEVHVEPPEDLDSGEPSKLVATFPFTAPSPEG